jgi:hypothetical protein
MTCLAVWTAMRPNSLVERGIRMISPGWASGFVRRASSIGISKSGSSTVSTAVFWRNTSMVLFSRFTRAMNDSVLR